jgi:hypothetical protein
MTETPERCFARFHLAYPSGAAVMAFYAGVAMPGEAQATHLLAVVEAVEASGVSVGIPRRIGHERRRRDVRRGCIGEDAEILRTQDGKSLLLAGTPMNKARCRSIAWEGEA